MKLYARDPCSYTPLANQYWKSKGTRSLTLSSDLEFNRKEIAKFSKRDAEVLCSHVQTTSVNFKIYIYSRSMEATKNGYRD